MAHRNRVLDRFALLWKRGQSIDSSADLKSLIHPGAAPAARPEGKLERQPVVWHDAPPPADPMDTYVAVLKSAHGRGA